MFLRDHGADCLFESVFLADAPTSCNSTSELQTLPRDADMVTDIKTLLKKARTSHYVGMMLRVLLEDDDKLHVRTLCKAVLKQRGSLGLLTPMCLRVKADKAIKFRNWWGPLKDRVGKDILQGKATHPKKHPPE